MISDISCILPLCKMQHKLTVSAWPINNKKAFLNKDSYRGVIYCTFWCCYLAIGFKYMNEVIFQRQKFCVIVEVVLLSNYSFSNRENDICWIQRTHYKALNILKQFTILLALINSDSQGKHSNERPTLRPRK